MNEREEVLKNRALFGKLDKYQLKSYTNSVIAVEFNFALKYDLWTRINISSVEVAYTLFQADGQTCVREGSIKLGNSVEANLSKFTLICNIDLK